MVTSTYPGQLASEVVAHHGPWRFTRETVVTDPLAAQFYELYELTFSPLKTRSVARQVLTMTEFYAQMADPRVDKYIAWNDDGQPVGITTLTKHLESVPWISPEYFAAHYPEHWARHAVYYLGFTLAHPSMRQHGFLEAIIRVGMDPLAAERAVLALRRVRLQQHRAAIHRADQRYSRALSVGSAGSRRHSGVLRGDIRMSLGTVGGMVSRRVAVIIEDDADIRNLLEAILGQAGFVCYTAATGAEGIASIREHEPILTTLDISLPGIDGFEVARQIRSFSSTYIIMLSARDEEIDTLMGLDAGADDYLTKPFRPRELRARIEAMLRRYHIPAGDARRPSRSPPERRVNRADDRLLEAEDGGGGEDRLAEPQRSADQRRHVAVQPGRRPGRADPQRVRPAAGDHGGQPAGDLQGHARPGAAR